MFANKRIDFDDEKSRRFSNNLSIFFRQGSPAGRDLINISPLFRFVSSRFKFNQKVIKQTQDYMRVNKLHVNSTIIHCTSYEYDCIRKNENEKTEAF